MSGMVVSLGEMYLCLSITFQYVSVDMIPWENIVSINVSVASDISWLNLVHISASRKPIERTFRGFCLFYCWPYCIYYHAFLASEIRNSNVIGNTCDDCSIFNWNRKDYCHMFFYWEICVLLIHLQLIASISWLIW